MEESQAFTATVTIYFERKIQSLKEFHQIGKEISLILRGSVNRIWTVALLCNVMFLLVVKDTTNKTETFLKNVKQNA